MNRHLPYVLAGSLIAAILLAGCTSDSGSSASSAGNKQTQSGGTAARQDEISRGNGSGMNRANLNIGQIKSISGSVITVYTTEMPADRPQGGSGQGAAPEAGAESGQPPEGAGTPPEGGQAPDGQGNPPGGMPEGGRPDETGQGGGMRGGGMMPSFSGATAEITVGSNTTFVSVTFDNGTRQETAIRLADLKSDDIIQYTLKTGTNEAEQITLGADGFGGGAPGRNGAPGAAPDSGSAEGTGESSASGNSSGGKP